MHLWALTGGIAAGKSLAAGFFRGLGARVLSADSLLDSLYVAGSEAFERISQVFGKSVFTSEGELDRCYLSKIIFADSEARKCLNEIIHPLIRHKAQEYFTKFFNEYPSGTLVYEIPLLAETAASIIEYDLIILVRAPLQDRINRIIQRDGLTRFQAMQRIYAQADDKQREAVANCLIDNIAEPSFLEQQVTQLWNSRR